MPDPGSPDASTASADRRSEAPDSSETLIERLGREGVPRDEKYRIVELLVLRVNHETIDALVASAADPRMFDPEGEAYQGSLFPGGQTRPVAVGAECTFCVARMLFPKTLYFGPVKDVLKWWNEHRHLSMDEILRLAREADRPAPPAPPR